MMLVAVLCAATLLMLGGVELGIIHLPLPSPPVGRSHQTLRDPPPSTVPQRWNRNFVGNDVLKQSRLLFKDQVCGAETVAFASDDRLAAVDITGQVHIAKLANDTKQYEVPDVVAHITQGRSLATMFDSHDNLYICNSPLGLLQLTAPGTPQQQLTIASNKVSADSPFLPGVTIQYADALDIAKDGTVYFTSATALPAYREAEGTWNVLDSLYASLAIGVPSGFLLAYYPHNHSTHVLMDRLWFTNGVSLAHDESYVLVTDLLQATVYRYWISGPKQGTREIFIDMLPGAPDGIHRAADGINYWLSLPGDFPKLCLYTNSRVVRLLLAWAPRLMRLLGMDLPKRGLVLKVSPSGEILQVLGDMHGQTVWLTTSAVEHGGKLFLGTLRMCGIPVYEL